MEFYIDTEKEPNEKLLEKLKSKTLNEYKKIDKNIKADDLKVTIISPECNPDYENPNFWLVCITKSM